MKGSIIPVTRAIRDYLRKKEKNDGLLMTISNLFNGDGNNYSLRRRHGSIVLVRNGEDTYQVHYDEEVQKKIEVLKKIALDLDKSLVWVYETMVLDGYGDDIDAKSDIYQASMLAYKDVSFIIRHEGEEVAFEQEANILNGHKYDKMVKKYSELIDFDRHVLTRKRDESSSG